MDDVKKRPAGWMTKSVVETGNADQKGGVVWKASSASSLPSIVGPVWVPN